MSRFFFDLHDDGRVHIDEEGIELSGFEEARQEAKQFVPDIVRERIMEAGDRRSFVVLVRDADGRAIYSATLSFAGTCYWAEHRCTGLAEWTDQASILCFRNAVGIRSDFFQTRPVSDENVTALGTDRLYPFKNMQGVGDA